MTQSNSPFIIVSTQRSGSTWVIDLLNSHPDIAAYTELFLPQGQGVPDWGRYKDVEYWNTYHQQLKPKLVRLIRPMGIFQYLDNLFARHPDKKAVGLKLMYGQIFKFAEILLYLMIRRIRVVHLIRRNTLDKILSGMAMKSRNISHARQGYTGENIRMQVDPKWLLREMSRIERQCRLFSFLLNRMGVPYLELGYENLVENPLGFNVCLEFLDCSQAALSSNLVKLNPSSHTDSIENFEEVKDALTSSAFAMHLRS